MMILALIKESLGLKRWGSFDLQAGPKETRILRNWEIANIPEYIGHCGEENKTGISLDTSDPPSENMYKLNFDGASKGNLGPIGFGGAILNSEGNLVGLY